MTDAERTLLLAVARALADVGRIDWRLLRAVLDEQAECERQAENVARMHDTAGNHAIQAELDAVVRERLDAAIARGRMLAAAMD